MLGLRSTAKPLSMFYHRFIALMIAWVLLKEEEDNCEPSGTAAKDKEKEQERKKNKKEKGKGHAEQTQGPDKTPSPPRRDLDNDEPTQLI